MEQVWIFAASYPEVYRLVQPYRQGFNVFGYAPSQRSRLMLGLPIFDVATTPVSRKTLLIVAHFQDIQPELVAQMKHKVTEAGGRVILTSDQNNEMSP